MDRRTHLDAKEGWKDQEKTLIPPIKFSPVLPGWCLELNNYIALYTVVKSGGHFIFY
jgi:hypothetical protein